MSYSISNSKYGVNIGVGGYHDKQKELLEKIFKRFTEYQVDEDRFKILKEFKTANRFIHPTYANGIVLFEKHS